MATIVLFVLFFFLQEESPRYHSVVRKKLGEIYPLSRKCFTAVVQLIFVPHILLYFILYYFMWQVAQYAKKYSFCRTGFVKYLMW